MWWGIYGQIPRKIWSWGILDLYMGFLRNGRYVLPSFVLCSILSTTCHKIHWSKSSLRGRMKTARKSCIFVGLQRIESELRKGSSSLKNIILYSENTLFIRNRRNKNIPAETGIVFWYNLFSYRRLVILIFNTFWIWAYSSMVEFWSPKPAIQVRVLVGPHTNP